MHMVYAHTRKDAPEEDWEPLYGACGHAEKVAALLAGFPPPFVPELLTEPSPLWRILGLYHDMGKASRAFQDYLHRSARTGKRTGVSVDHKSAAARWWWNGSQSNELGDQNSNDIFGLMLAYAFQGHHGGLPNGTAAFADAFFSSNPDEALQALPPELRQKPDLGKAPQLGKAGYSNRDGIVFALCFMTRMLHSALVDADWLATEAFTEPESSRRRREAAADFESIHTLGSRLEEHLAAVEADAAGSIDALRREIHAACRAAAAQEPGVFRLNVPTGGGKTLSSLSFALAHAGRHGLRRVIYVIPYTSIIDQTADVFRRVLGDKNVVEHHSNLGEGHDTEQNKHASENWDAPLIVTTAVQFFESLFACRNSRCRKVHNIAHSVIIFDEAQTLPANLLAPCLAAMKALQRLCGCSLVLCTATQPTLEYREDFKIGWDASEIRSIIGKEREKRLAREMKRVEVTELGHLDTASLVEHFRSSGGASALFIVNLTRQAQDLYAALKETRQPGLYHLSARMCPAHRRETLGGVCGRLKAGEPAVCVATRVVEAGVDLSFPAVYRDRCGLDSLAQAAGRCNRHGEAAMGRVFSYSAAEAEYALPAKFVDLAAGAAAREDVLQGPGEDPFSPETISKYFRSLYAKLGARTLHWDDAGIMRKIGGTLGEIRCWDFPAIAEGFQLIPGGQISVIMPYGERAEKLRTRLLERQRAGIMPAREDFLEARQLAVNVYRAEWTDLQKHCECVHEGAGLYMLADTGAYSRETGLLREYGGANYIL